MRCVSIYTSTYLRRHDHHSNSYLSLRSPILRARRSNLEIHTYPDSPSPLSPIRFLTAAVLANESTVTFKNESDGRNVELDVRGTWYDRSASVTFGGEPVAHISRSIFNMREILADKDTVSRFL